MKTLIVGDSHTAALHKGLASLVAAGRSELAARITIRPLGGGHLLPTPFFEDCGDHAAIVAPLYLKNFARLPPDAGFTGVIGLCMPLWPMRVQHKIVWSDHCLAPTLPGRHPISNAVFRQMVLADQAHVLRLIDLFRRQGILVIAVSGPGLFRDHATVRKLPGHSALQMFQTYRAIMLDQLEARKVPTVDIPRQCLDTEGYMTSDFRNEDPDDDHHANAAFGALMIDQIDLLVAGFPDQGQAAR